MVGSPPPPQHSNSISVFTPILRLVLQQSFDKSLPTSNTHWFVQTSIGLQPRRNLHQQFSKCAGPSYGLVGHVPLPTLVDWFKAHWHANMILLTKLQCIHPYTYVILAISHALRKKRCVSTRYTFSHVFSLACLLLSSYYLHLSFAHSRFIYYYLIIISCFPFSCHMSYLQNYQISCMPTIY